MLTRREFFLTGAAAFAAPLGLQPAARFDLVIQGGRVLDPERRLDRVMDVAIRDGRIAGVESSISTAAGDPTFNARGKLVLPGLIDAHAHPRPGDLTPARCLETGVTTIVDGGSRGSDGIDEMITVAREAPNRVRILINVSRLGNSTDGELLDLNNIKLEATQEAIRRHRDTIVGIKVRVSKPLAGNRDLDAVRRANEVRRPFDLPLMIHIGESVSPLPELLALLRKGDIVTHVYAPDNGILDSSNRVLPQVREARRRGILFDVGNGRNGHITWEVAERAIRQDFLPDTISSDLTGTGLTDRAFDLPTILSKFLLVGMTLEQIIACATIKAAKAIPTLDKLGTLKNGTTADVSIFDLAQGDFEFVDNLNVKRIGHQKLVPHAVFVAGKRFV